MRSYTEIMQDAAQLPGNTLIVTAEEAEACITRFVEDIHVEGISAELARRKLRTSHLSLCGKQVTVGR